MAIQTLYPNIEPSLNLSFALTKALDPRVSFTRTTTATYYDGKTTAKAEENLLLRSQDYSATWTVTNLTPVTGKTAPDGTSTATEFTAGAANAVLTQGYTAIAGSYTFSVFLRRVTGTGTIEIAADNGTWTAKTITGTWARYDVTQTVAAGSKTAGVRVVTSGDAIDAWGAQLEQRSAVTAYTPTTTQPITNYIPVLLTAASGVARFDHNPTTGESLGLLIEEQRTNLLLRSEEFNDAAWTKSSFSIVSNTVVAPDGTLTAEKFVLDNGADPSLNNATGLNQILVLTSGVYTYSIYAKAGEFTSLRVRETASTGAFLDVNLLTGVITNQNTTQFSNANAISVGNGWWRIFWTSPSGMTNANKYTFRVTQTGNGFSGIYIWGAQLEEGAFPTSYIPTVAATVTRNADNASMTGTNFTSWFNNAEGTLYAEASTLNVPASGERSVFRINPDGSTTNEIRIRYVDGTLRGQIQNATGETFSQGTTALANVSYRSILAYKENDSSFTRDGSTATTDSSVSLPTNLAQAHFGSRSTTSVAPLNGTIRKLAYYPSRLTNAQLQALTS